MLNCGKNKNYLTSFIMLIKMLYAKPGNGLEEYGFRKYAIHNSDAKDTMTSFALNILTSKIYDA